MKVVEVWRTGCREDHEEASQSCTKSRKDFSEESKGLAAQKSAQGRRSSAGAKVDEGGFCYTNSMKDGYKKILEEYHGLSDQLASAQPAQIAKLGKRQADLLPHLDSCRSLKNLRESLTRIRKWLLARRARWHCSRRGQAQRSSHCRPGNQHDYYFARSAPNG